MPGMPGAKARRVMRSPLSPAVVTWAALRAWGWLIAQLFVGLWRGPACDCGARAKDEIAALRAGWRYFAWRAQAEPSWRCRACMFWRSTGGRVDPVGS